MASSRVGGVGNDTDAFIPIVRVEVGEAEIAEVVATLRSGWLTTGPRVAAFEQACKEYLGARHAVALSSGTAALHLSLLALGIGPGDEVITTPLTFASTVNAILFVGATPVLADVDAQTLALSPARVADAVTPRTRAILPVHYAGAGIDVTAYPRRVGSNDLAIVEDAALAFGATVGGQKVGSQAHAACFSFHPVKNLTTAEGGLFVTDDTELEKRVRLASWHGIEKGALSRYKERGGWFFEVETLGYKYNMSDVCAAIGLHQLAAVNEVNRRRVAHAAVYDQILRAIEGVRVAPPPLPGDIDIRLPYWLVLDPTRYDRDRFIDEMGKRRIGTAVHYVPIHLQRYYRERFGWKAGLCPVAEAAYEGLVSIPLFPTLTETERTRVLGAAVEALEACRR